MLMESKISVTGLFPVCIFSNFIERKFSTIEKKAIDNAYIKSFTPMSITGRLTWKESQA